MYNRRPVDLSRDGSLVAFGSDDQAVCIVTFEAGKPVHRLVGHAGPVCAVSFSPDGLLLISGSKDGTARIWDTKSGVLVHSLTHPGGGGVLSAAWSPDGRSIVTGCGCGRVTVWTAAGELVRSFDEHTEEVMAVSFSPDGLNVLSGSFDSNALLIEVATGRVVRRVNVKDYRITVATFSPDGEFVLTAGVTGAHVWDADTFEMIGDDPCHRDMQFASYTPSGTHIAAPRNGMSAPHNDPRLYTYWTRPYLYPSSTPRSFSEVEDIELEDFIDPESAARFSHDGRSFVLADFKTVVRYRSPHHQVVWRVSA